MPVYGCALSEHLRRNEREIAYVIEECVATLFAHGLEEEVSFNISK